MLLFLLFEFHIYCLRVNDWRWDRFIDNLLMPLRFFELKDILRLACLVIIDCATHFIIL